MTATPIAALTAGPTATPAPTFVKSLPSTSTRGDGVSTWVLVLSLSAFGLVVPVRAGDWGANTFFFEV